MLNALLRRSSPAVREAHRFVSCLQRGLARAYTATPHQQHAEPFAHEGPQPLQGMEVPAVTRTCMSMHTLRAALDVQHSSAMQTAVQLAQLNGTGGSLWHCSQSEERGLPIVRVLEAQSSPPGGTLHAVVPDRWVSLDVSSQGQDIGISRITEAGVSCFSRGGHVNLGTIRSGKIDVSTEGPTSSGNLTGGDLSASDLALCSGSGAITVRRVLGLRASISASNAPVSINAAYAENLSLSSGGGRVSIANLSCSRGAHITSSGGDITVDSLDSGAHLDSSGGAIKVHLQENVGAVHIQSKSGDVEVAVTPQAHVTVFVVGAGKISCSVAEAIQGKEGENILELTPVSKGSPTRGTNTKRPEGASTSTVHVHACGGKVTVRRAGWMEMVQQRMMQAKTSN